MPVTYMTEVSTQRPRHCLASVKSVQLNHCPQIRAHVSPALQPAENTHEPGIPAAVPAVPSKPNPVQMCSFSDLETMVPVTTLVPAPRAALARLPVTARTRRRTAVRTRRDTAAPQTRAATPPSAPTARKCLRQVSSLQSQIGFHITPVFCSMVNTVRLPPGHLSHCWVQVRPGRHASGA